MLMFSHNLLTDFSVSIIIFSALFLHFGLWLVLTINRFGVNRINLETLSEAYRLTPMRISNAIFVVIMLCIGIYIFF